MDKPKSVEEYFSWLDDRQRAALTKLREVIDAAAPGSTPAISYGMPGIKDAKGRGVVAYAAFKDHYSLFPMGTSMFELYAEELAPYKAGKGTIQFSYDEKLPVGLVKKIVKARLKENDAWRKERGR